MIYMYMFKMYIHVVVDAASSHEWKCVALYALHTESAGQYIHVHVYVCSVRVEIKSPFHACLLQLHSFL